MHPSLYSVALACCAITSISLAATLPAVEDTYSAKGKLTAASNKASSLTVDAAHSAYVYFDLNDLAVNQASQIRYARLRLYFPKVLAAGGGIELQIVTAPWDETTIGNEPVHAGGVAGTIAGDAIATKRFASVDVTGAVKAWVGGTTANSGFAIVAKPDARLAVAAKEGSGSGYPAELEVELNPGLTSVTGSQLASDLTLAGTTTGTFSGDGSMLTGLKASNLTGQLSATQLTSNLALSGTTSGTFAGDGSALTSLNADAVSTAATAATFISWVSIGDPGNPADPANTATIPGIGAVAQKYDISKYEITNAQYAAFLNAVAATDSNSLYNTNMGTSVRGGIARVGVSGSYRYVVKKAMGDKPVNFVSFYDALRFCNWLHNGRPSGAQDAMTTEDGAYAMITESYPSAVISRKSGAKVFVPSETEWYKAAFYDPAKNGAGGYWQYTMQSDTPPNFAAADGFGRITTVEFLVANFNSGATWNGVTGNVTTVGSAGPGGESAYGVADMAGNVGEWNEDISGSQRGLQGGSWITATTNDLKAAPPYHVNPAMEDQAVGFRVARP